MSQALSFQKRTSKSGSRKIIKQKHIKINPQPNSTHPHICDKNLFATRYVGVSRLDCCTVERENKKRESCTHKHFFSCRYRFILSSGSLLFSCLPLRSESALFYHHLSVRKNGKCQPTTTTSTTNTSKLIHKIFIDLFSTLASLFSFSPFTKHTAIVPLLHRIFIQSTDLCSNKYPEWANVYINKLLPSLQCERNEGKKFIRFLLIGF